MTKGYQSKYTGEEVEERLDKVGELVEEVEKVRDEAFSGDYNDLTNKPNIPTRASELTNDSGFLTEHQDISGKQDVIKDLDAIRANAAKGATALQSIPDSSVSEAKLTADVRNKLNSSGGGDSSSKYKVSLPANYGVRSQGKGVAITEKYYNVGSAPIINLVCKFLKTGNIYAYSHNLLALIGDSGNSFKFGLFQGYDLRLQLVINGSVLREVKYSKSDAIWKALINSHSWILTFDYVTRRFIVKTKSTSAGYSSSFVIDISDWELELLGDFKISTEIGALYTPFLGSKYFYFNDYADNDYYLNTKLLVDNYSPFPVTSYGELVSTTDLQIKVGGTRVETISPTHVINSYNVETSGYFAMGCLASGGYQINSRFAIMVRFNEITSETVIYAGAGYRVIYVFDEELNLVNKTINENIGFVPEVGKLYIFVVVMSREIEYTSSFAFKVKGAGTVEVKALYVSYPQMASLGSLNWDGEYFTGYIPFKGYKIEFEKIESMDVPPLYSLRVDSGKILMFNGDAWKQVSNA